MTHGYNDGWKMAIVIGCCVVRFPIFKIFIVHSNQSLVIKEIEQIYCIHLFEITKNLLKRMVNLATFPSNVYIYFPFGLHPLIANQERFTTWVFFCQGSTVVVHLSNFIKNLLKRMVNLATFLRSVINNFVCLLVVSLLV